MGGFPGNPNMMNQNGGPDMGRNNNNPVENEYSRRFNSAKSTLEKI